MDYPRALDSSPEDRGLGVRDWRSPQTSHTLNAPTVVQPIIPKENPYYDTYKSMMISTQLK